MSLESDIDAAPAALDPDGATAWERLHPRARLAMQGFTALGLALPLALPAAVVIAAWDSGGVGLVTKVALFVIVVALGAAAGWAWGGARHAHTWFALDAGGLRIRRGVFWRSETFVPRSRVQHTDLNRGPLDRRLGLATLKVYTAGTKLASVAIDGLPEARAEALRDALVNHVDDAL